MVISILHAECFKLVNTRVIRLAPHRIHREQQIVQSIHVEQIVITADLKILVTSLLNRLQEDSWVHLRAAIGKRVLVEDLLFVPIFLGARVLVLDVLVELSHHFVH